MNLKYWFLIIIENDDVAYNFFFEVIIYSICDYDGVAYNYIGVVAYSYIGVVVNLCTMKSNIIGLCLL